MQRRSDYADPITRLEAVVRESLSEFAKSAVPRGEHEARWEAQERSNAQLGSAIEKLTDVVRELKDSMGREFTPQRQFEQAIQQSVDDRRELHKEIDALKEQVAKGFQRQTMFTAENINKILIVAVTALATFAVYSLSGLFHP